MQSESYVGWLVALRIYVALAVSQPYRDLEAGDKQSLKFKWRGGELNPGPLAPQAKSLTTRPTLLAAELCALPENEPFYTFLERDDASVTVANFRIFKIHKFRSYITCHSHYFT